MNIQSVDVDDEAFVFNGLDADTGAYLLPPLRPRDVAALAQGEPLNPARLAELRFRHQQATLGHFAVKAGVDPTRLEEAGWGVIFAQDVDPGIREALRPLLEHRRHQATARHGHYFKEYAGDDGYRPGETKNQFLARHGVGPGPVDPEKVPYYLLIVGDPEQIPYSFQYQLDVAYAVGRLHFDGDRPEDVHAKYTSYARSVIAAETGAVTRSNRAVFFGVRNPGDRSTQYSADYLTKPLAERMAQAVPSWTVEPVLGETATRARLARLLGGDDTPAFLFTAGHGVGCRNGDPRQLAKQGALVCQDWGGPESPPAPLDDYCFSAETLAAGANLHGLVTFHFACYGAGTPRLDAYTVMQANTTERKEKAPRSFVARLPQALLSHPYGGALAVAGHVERAWSYAYLWPGASVQTATFESALTLLLNGDPVGLAFECFNNRHAELSVTLAAELEEIRFGKTPDDAELAAMWTANNDARGWAILGDPAVRLPPAP